MKNVKLFTIISLICAFSFSATISPQLIKQAQQQYGLSDAQVQQAAKQVIGGTPSAAPVRRTTVNIQELKIKQAKELSSANEPTKKITEKVQDEPVISVSRKDFKPEVSMQFPKELKRFGYNIFNEVAISFTPLSNVPVAGDYVLGAGDELKVYLWGSIQQAFSLMIDSGGDIVLPKAGKIRIANFTLDQAKRIINKEMKKNFANFTMDITMGQLKTMDIFVLGEVYAPGRYNVNSLASVIYALYYSGGPTYMGSLRNIKLIRNRKTVKVIDLYKLLLTGDKSDDSLLKPGDTIFVPKAGRLAAIKGAVKSPAIYELKGYTSLQSLMSMAGNYTRTSYVGEVNIIKKDKDEYVLKTLSFPSRADFEALSRKIIVKNGDIIEIKSISDRVNNWVQINGSIKYPGLFSIDKVQTMADLIQRSGGYKDNTYLERANIYRVTTDNHYIVVPVDLQTDNLSDIKLSVFDKVVIYNNDDIIKEESVSIAGEVYKPGTFFYYSNLSLEDALFFGGQTKPMADMERIEISRYNTRTNLWELLYVNAQTDTLSKIKLQAMDKVKVYSRDLSYKKYMVSISGLVYKPGEYKYYTNITLKDLIFQAKGFSDYADATNVSILRKLTKGDNKIITINTSKTSLSDIVLQPFDRVYVRQDPAYNSYGSVVVEGEVLYPGTYPLHKNETLSQLIVRAGGFNDNAFVPGIVLSRDMTDETTQLSKQEVKTDDESLKSIARLANFNRLRINYHGLFKEKDLARYDIEIRDGDKLIIPTYPQEIKVIGGVYNQGSFIYEGYRDIGYYLERAGMFRKDAEAGELYIVHADGTVTKTNNHGYRIDRGDSIVVPTKKLIEFNFIEALLDWTQIIFNVATTWKVIFN